MFYPFERKCLFHKSHLKPFCTICKIFSARSSYDLDHLKENFQSNEVMQNISQVFVPRRSESIGRPLVARRSE